MGITPPSDPFLARNLLDRAIPNVGTIHALCYRLLGRPPMLKAKDLKEFAQGVNPNTHARFEDVSPDVVEGYEYSDVEATDSVQFALQVYAMSRHRMVSVADAMRSVSLRPSVSMIAPSAEYVEAIARKYEDYKRQTGKIDFEDMLEQGRNIPLGVAFLLCDEVQDNSALLWSVIDGWVNAGVLRVVMAGDPWQAIYLFSGAAPELFRNRSGKWHTIGNSRRLSSSSAKYALTLLKLSGYAEDSLLSTWTGEGGNATEAGSAFYLARTNALLRPIREQLEGRGVPYRLLRGVGPLQTKAAKTFRQWVRDVGDSTQSLGDASENPITSALATLVADQAPPGSLPRGYKALYERLAAEMPDQEVPNEHSLALRAAVQRIPHYNYFYRVYRQHGLAPFVLPAKTAVGTIHAAKGREADEVYLVRSWGWLPGRALNDGHEKEEACVAYVGATRHRSKLTILDGFEGIPYPFPSQIERGT